MGKRYKQKQRMGPMPAGIINDAFTLHGIKNRKAVVNKKTIEAHSHIFVITF
jgi:hypothetical protein